MMLVLSSPSGAGKTTIAKSLLARDTGFTVSVSATTRPPRPGEVDGVDYRFVDDAAFDRLLAENQLLEHAVVFGNRYGTPREPVEAALAAGRDVLFDVDWQGAQQLRANAADDLVGIFILPPSYEELARRLNARGQDSAEVVRGRMAKAAGEMSHWNEYDYVVVNQVAEEATAQVEAIITAERHRRPRLIGLADFVGALCGNP
ncbi:MAG: guanylate kinase [Rhodospirillales bacterium]|nr:guanylate kinase [Rhodospirillales bacterium]